MIKTKSEILQESFIKHCGICVQESGNIGLACLEAMKLFAQYHVKLALEKAAKGCIDIHHEIADLPQNCNDYEESVTQYIENIYPLDNIK